MAQFDQHVYSGIASAHKALPAFSPYFSDALLPYLAFFLLASTFTLTFYFTTLPKNKLPVQELAVASLASALGGFGIVALFCSVGVYV